MNYLGETISLGVAFSWTIAALASEVGTRRLGVMAMNVWRLGLAFVVSCPFMWLTMGAPYPVYASTATWAWLVVSGIVGYFFGDWCLFNCYLCVGSRMGQLFMTLAPMFAAFAAWMMIGQTLTWAAVVAMVVTLLGIAITVLGRDDHHHVAVTLPLKGIVYGIGAALGQGFGLVLSKIGLDHYTGDVPAVELAGVVDYLPFASNMIRCLAGTLCFWGWLVVSGHSGKMRESLHEHKGLACTILAVFFGPFIGVGFSLMAVQYTAAGIASTIMAMTPIIILLPSRWLFGQPLTVRGVLGAVISVVGVSLFFLL